MVCAGACVCIITAGQEAILSADNAFYGAQVRWKQEKGDRMHVVNTEKVIQAKP